MTAAATPTGPPPGDAAGGSAPGTPAAAGEPRWLSSSEMAAWLPLVRLVTLLPAALDRQLREEAGIPHAHYQVLAMLSDAPGRAMRMSDLARLTGTSQSRLSHAVAGLEERGWVHRRPCADDRRGMVAHLTDAGLAVLRATAPGHVANARRLVFDRLTPDESAQLGVLAARLLEGLDDRAAKDGPTLPASSC